MGRCAKYFLVAPEGHSLPGAALANGQPYCIGIQSTQTFLLPFFHFSFPGPPPSPFCKIYMILCHLQFWHHKPPSQFQAGTVPPGRLQKAPLLLQQGRLAPGKPGSGRRKSIFVLAGCQGEFICQRSESRSECTRHGRARQANTG